MSSLSVTIIYGVFRVGTTWITLLPEKVIGLQLVTELHLLCVTQQSSLCLQLVPHITLSWTIVQKLTLEVFKCLIQLRHVGHMLKISLSVMQLQRSQLLKCVLKCVYSLSDIVDMCFCTEINVSIPVRCLDGSGNLLNRDGNSGIVKCGSKSVINEERESVCVWAQACLHPPYLNKSLISEKLQDLISPFEYFNLSNYI
jgi:hypothetical protein